MSENLAYLHEMLTAEAFASHTRDWSKYGFFNVKPKNGVWPNYLFEMESGAGDLKSILSNRDRRDCFDLLLLEEGEYYRKNFGGILRPVTRWCDMVLELDPSLVEGIEIDPDVELSEVHSESELAVWKDCVELGLFQNKSLADRMFWDMLCSDVFEFWLLRHQDVVKGAAMTFKNSGNSRGLYFFVVRSQYQRSGLGKRFLEKLVEMSIDAGAKSINLQSTVEGYRLYQKMGFKNICKYLLFPLSGSNVKK